MEAWLGMLRASNMGKRVKIGDVIEIPTSVGLAYAQFSHKHDDYGALIRVLPGVHTGRPMDLGGLVDVKETYCVFLWLQSAINRGIFEVVGNHPVPLASRSFPLFRCGLPDRTGKVRVWWLWDGEREWMVGDIGSEQRKLSIRGIWTDPLLIERIEEGWLPETDSR